uniref:Uncharacterized protein n=1 Tax=Mus spicilegus TaxID=10103 RepID=A0A8C6GXJ7_MUSSI
MHPVYLTSTSSCCSQCTRVTPTQSLQIEGSRSSPKWRHRGEDSSTGEMPPMPTSPGEDLQNPTAQNALFSSLSQIHSSAIPLDFDVTHHHQWHGHQNITADFGDAGDLFPMPSLCPHHPGRDGLTQNC